ncbi:C40 family peptidase [Kineosporia sp. J2-2]|uniref:C40 family peptidase n=2 Tax=Kineosporia corallincola TaxID=2835133 RepID=A0ABS5TPD3_9ACTN|nr:C40 family peptidase [Kineosporia corallincola]
MTLMVQAVVATVGDAPSALAAGLFDSTGTICGTGDAAQKRRREIVDLAGEFDVEQRANAATIVRIGRRLAVPMRGWLVAVATAIQESSLRNVDHGDAVGPDSRGLFQQRAAWGPEEDRTAPAAAARMFYTGGQAGQPGLLDVKGWQRMPLTEAAQAVQRSSKATAYAEHEDEAAALVLLTVLGTRPSGTITLPADLCTTSLGPGDVVGAAIAYARRQLGQPYLWGGDGPDAGERGFDCSGLTAAAYEAAGITLPRTAQQQYDHGPRVPLDRLQPGDLVFFGAGSTTISHVGIYLGNHQMIDAPHTGAAVRIEDHRWDNLIAATRPTGITTITVGS